MKRPTGMFAFTLVWIGQIVSMLGTSMTAFAMTIWAYEQSGLATALALVGFFFVTPMLLVSPFAGAIVDRQNLKWMMMLSDLAAGLATIAVLILYQSGQLQIWHLYITSAIQGVFNAFQWPAYSAAISTMLPKEQYGRANGMMSLVEMAGGLLAPMLAGALIKVIGVGGILGIDVVTFVVAVGALLIVHVPQPPRSAEGHASQQGGLLREAAFGFRYILAKPSLLGLQLVFLTANFLIGVPQAVFAAMILARSGSDSLVLGAVNTAGAVGGVLGGVAMSAWGGPKRRVHGVLFGWFLSGLFASVLIGTGQSVVWWAAGAFLTGSLVALINGSNQAIWQSKVPPDLQGKVFSIRRLIAWFVSPLSMLLAGPLADRVLEPAMRQPSAVQDAFSWLVGSGPGAGMGLMFVFGGLGAGLIGLLAYLVPAVRNAETLLPDHDVGGHVN